MLVLSLWCCRRTFVPPELREEYLAGLAGSDFAPHTYDLFRHNCNTFSATYSEFLTGNSIPVSSDSIAALCWVSTQSHTESSIL